MFIDKEDGKIARVLWNYFMAVETKWESYWKGTITGNVLNRTTGFNALMQFLPFAYVSFNRPDEIPTPEQFNEIFERVDIEGADINRDRYVPGTSGVTQFREELKTQTGLL